MRRESEFLYNNLFNEEERLIIDRGTKIVENNSRIVEDYNFLWEYDQSIGGIGGYCAPLNPTIQPFKHGEERQLFRSLQYARCHLFLIPYFSRFIIESSGLHLEDVLKVFVSKKVNLFQKDKVYDWTLGRLINWLKDYNIVDIIVLNNLNNILDLYNMSKHHIDPINDKTFDVKDSLISYFSCRKYGLLFLSMISHYSINTNYSINNIRCYEEIEERINKK